MKITFILDYIEGTPYVDFETFEELDEFKRMLQIYDDVGNIGITIIGHNPSIYERERA